MPDICPICGLPEDLCVCGEIGKEQQRIRIRLERRKWGRESTIIDGLSQEDIDLEGLSKELKSLCACGGTAKQGYILLQGDHREKVRRYLIKQGYPSENIQLQ